MNTRQLTERVMCERKLDVSDTPLRNSVVFKVVQSLRHAARRKRVVMIGKHKRICVWEVVVGVTLDVASNRSYTD